MEKKIIIAIIFLMIPVAFADCIDPYDGMEISEDTEFCGGTYDLRNGIKITADDVLLNCKTSILRGDTTGTGIILQGVNGVEIRECTVITHDIGILIEDSKGNLIIDNGILKNRIGVRLLDSYENTITDNNDKSFIKAVSSVNSKFNVYDYGNINIDKEFCEDNYCNDAEKTSVCVDDDFYCSDKCDHTNDNDCKAPVVETPKEKEPSILDEIEDIEPEPVKAIPPSPAPVKPPRYWIYPLAYLIMFLMIEFTAYVKRYDREGG